MASNIKKYILTAVTLGLIAASGALLIAGTNMITRGTIAKNEENKINNGILNLYKDYPNPYLSNDTDLTKENYQYVNHIYYINNNNGSNSYEPIGYAFLTSGSNMYGKISLIVGFNNTKTFIGISIITNEQTYASTLVENYVDPLNSNDRSLEDVSCGATYGAKLVRDMVNEASKAIKKVEII